MDAVKKHVVEKIAHLLDSTTFGGPSAPDILEVTVSHPTSLQTQLRVKTKSDGTHYFLVKISEAL